MTTNKRIWARGIRVFVAFIRGWFVRDAWRWERGCIVPTEGVGGDGERFFELVRDCN
ncbi:MAG TPA: hypothetical protein PLN86_15680 [Candidatus Hydrogenedentes bacterium]|nr:hypothetical protein [Candidatus Hydrogenedentota bacterium]